VTIAEIAKIAKVAKIRGPVSSKHWESARTS
jgi:hypothetical protein